MIKISTLDFGYRQGQRVLSGLDLDLQSGHIYGLFGKNGTGKSTLLKLICGLITPQAGEIEVLGFQPFKRPTSLMSDIFFVTEEIDVPNVTLSQLVKLYSPLYPKFDKEQLTQLVNEFELSLDQNLNSFSQGQRKKAIICFALACNTQLLLMDEPTNGLDIPAKSQFRRIISSLSNEQRCIIISTHQVRDLESLIDGVIIIDDKRAIINSTTDEISKKLQFGKIDKGELALYAEETIHGTLGITLNNSDTESRIDIEMLFNAVSLSPEKFSQILNTK